MAGVIFGCVLDHYNRSLNYGQFCVYKSRSDPLRPKNMTLGSFPINFDFVRFLVSFKAEIYLLIDGFIVVSEFRS